MTIGLAAMLAGLFGVPAVLLWTGHRLRRRPPRWRAAFWGALIAHVALAPAAMVAAMVPPAEWAPDDRWRGVFGFWALMLGPLLGALIGVARAPRPSQAGAPDGGRHS
jgi:hypothetical protein